MAESEMSQSKLIMSQRARLQSQQSLLVSMKRQSIWGKSSTSRLLSGLKVGSVLRTWENISKMNYLSMTTADERSSQGSENLDSSAKFLRKRSVSFPLVDQSMQCVEPEVRNKGPEDELVERFPPLHVTNLMSEGNLWGCFYNFPELYADQYSPVVLVRSLPEVPELIAGVLTKEMIATCLTYLKRTPILGDYVFIKLDLSSKHLVNIDVLRDYRYLTYLDLSSNYLTELSVLSYLLYLQFLSVSFNRLSTVLEYDVPQWFLTEVHYKFNSVTRIRDLSMLWSITVLDLSHNNIKCISGLEHLQKAEEGQGVDRAVLCKIREIHRYLYQCYVDEELSTAKVATYISYLRRLDLSFNHIQRLENLNHLRLIWLDVSYNNISSFEFGSSTGLWTLYHLEFLNLNENNLTSMKIFSGCTRLQELHVRNNRLSILLELAVYMRQLRRLVILDLRANPVCCTPCYKEVVINTFPRLLSLDGEELDPDEQRTLQMHVTPGVSAFSTRRLLRLLYIEQLSRAKVSPFVPPADTTEVPIVCLVGYEAVGKGTLSRRLANECSDHIELALQTTTSKTHEPGHYKELSRSKFDDMLLAGAFLTYTEMDGESYGLSREEAYVRDGRVRLVCLDLPSALILQNRGRRPYLILCTCKDEQAMKSRQLDRKDLRIKSLEKRTSIEVPIEKSTLQILVSGRILVTGILNEILMTLPDEKDRSQFVIESECSLLMDSEARRAMQDYARGVNMLTLMCSSSNTSLENVCNIATQKNEKNSLYSLYKDSQATDEYASDLGGNSSYSNSKRSAEPRHRQFQPHQDKLSDYKSMESKEIRGTSAMNSSKSSKSVTFTSQEAFRTANELGARKESGDTEGPPRDLTGLPIEGHKTSAETELLKSFPRSLSTKIMAWPKDRGGPAPPCRTASGGSIDDGDLWLSFLVETGLLQASDPNVIFSEEQTSFRNDAVKMDDPEYMLKLMAIYKSVPGVTSHFTTHSTRSVRDNYEEIHRNHPGLFYDTITMDDPDKAFIKAKKIIHRIVDSQKLLHPMFDIDFVNSDSYPMVQQRLKQIATEIAPKRFFL